jgi:cation/acetate symporter
MNSAEHWLFGISPEGIGSIGAVVNFTLAFVVSRLTPDVPADVVAMVNNIRIPKGVNRPSAH